MAIEASFPSLLPYGTLPAMDESIFLVNSALKSDSFNKNNSVDLQLPRKRAREPSAVTDNRSTAPLSFLGEDLSLYLIQQQLEIDRSIFLHTENFRVEIEEQMKNQWRKLLIAIEQKFVKILIDKEEQIQKIGKLNATLQDRIRSLYLENQLWRDLAQSNEATAKVLRSNLENLLVQINTKANDEFIRSGEVAKDEQSCCGSSGYVAADDVVEVDREEILRWRKVARTRGESGKRLCRICGDTDSSVLVLPCRHLCLCAACGPAVDACPVCNAVKNATVHVNFS